MDPQKDGILEKIRLLMEHAEGAKDVGNVLEAEAYAAKVHQLLLKYKLTLQEVDLRVEIQQDPVAKESVHLGRNGIKDRTRRVRWLEELAGITARANFCRILVRVGSSAIIFVGRKQNREVAVYLYTYLARQVERISQKEYDREYMRHWPSKTREMFGWKKSFIDGALAAFAERFRSDQSEILSTETSRALVTIEDTAVTDYLKALRLGQAAKFQSSPDFNISGYQSGVKFGRGVQVSQGQLPSGSGTKYIGQGGN